MFESCDTPLFVCNIEPAPFLIFQVQEKILACKFMSTLNPVFKSFFPIQMKKHIELKKYFASVFAKRQFLAILAAVHFTPVSRSLGGWVGRSFKLA